MKYWEDLKVSQRKWQNKCTKRNNSEEKGSKTTFLKRH